MYEYTFFYNSRIPHETCVNKILNITLVSKRSSAEFGYPMAAPNLDVLRSKRAFLVQIRPILDVRDPNLP